MKLTVLMDNNTYIDRYYLGEPAVSYWIEADGKRLLFDTGYSDAVLCNARAMGIDLSEADCIVLSHGHNDHTRGLMFLADRFDLHEKTLFAHPDCFDRKTHEDEDIGAPFSLKRMRNMMDVQLSREPVRITERLTFLGEIPMENDFEPLPAIGTVHRAGRDTADNLTEDTALVHKGDDGIFIITGCSHRGICNIAEYAKKVCGVQRVKGIIGGFHLFENDARLARTIEYFKAQGVELLYPCHCVSFKAKAEMSRTLEIGEVGVGMELIV